MSILVQIIVGILTNFLEYLFQQWVKQNPNGPYTALLNDNLAASKPQFVAKVNSYLLLRLFKSRLVIADKLFDKMVARYNSKAPIYTLSTSGDISKSFSDLAKSLTAGLEKEPIV